jgi:hypothetical protein
MAAHGCHQALPRGTGTLVVLPAVTASSMLPVMLGCHQLSLVVINAAKHANQVKPTQ